MQDMVRSGANPVDREGPAAGANPVVSGALRPDRSRRPFPPPTTWPIEEATREGWYFWLQQIDAVLPGGRVRVRGRGEMLMLSGYSYLGLGEHPWVTGAAKAALDDFGAGTHGSRLLAGTLRLHRELEEAIAAFKGTADAVVFSSGYVANHATLSCLLRKGDRLLADRNCHASIIDGCMASRAEFSRFAHNHAAALAESLDAATTERQLVVADAVFSMDGDILDLPAFARACREGGGLLMVDECHSVGVLGRTGRGIEEHFDLPADTIDIKMGTLSKAIPSAGGYVAGSAELCRFLRHEARGFLYSGSTPAPVVAAARAGLELLVREPWRVEKLRDNAALFRQRLLAMGFDLAGSETPIVPILVGEEFAAARLAAACQRRGLFIQAVFPPVVPKGTARLRATVMASHEPADLVWAADQILAAAREEGVVVGR